MDSSWIASSDYDSAEQTLSITTKGGETYNYLDVSTDTAQDFEAADSQGSFHNTEIRGRFDCEKQ